ncbi:MAG: hypothetical protein A2Y33_02685 [Spirochaetes bacterium GWF1_51_8]|nr:MAG: hypothetical protein A2Y33_02685 [Spirochaetes bacterium GWF1_51_8]
MFIYIILCSNETFYTGVTNDAERRFSEHEAGIEEDCYTFSRRPLRLLYTEFYDSPNDAIRREKQIKGWSHQKKQALIDRDLEELSWLSKSRNSRPSTSSG